MKQLFLLFFLTILWTLGQAQKANAILKKYAAAIGGQTKLNAINTLSYTLNLNVETPLGNLEIPLRITIANNKLFRADLKASLAGQDASMSSLATDTSGYLQSFQLTNAPRPLEKMNKEQQKLAMTNAHSEGPFPALVNSEAKQTKIEQRADEIVEGDSCWVLQLTLLGGVNKTYYLSKKTNWVKRVVIQSNSLADNMAQLKMVFVSLLNIDSNEENLKKLTIDFSNYQPTDGVWFPNTFTIRLGKTDLKGTISNIQINPPSNPQWYIL